MPDRQDQLRIYAQDAVRRMHGGRPIERDTPNEPGGASFYPLDHHPRPSQPAEPPADKSDELEVPPAENPS